MSRRTHRLLLAALTGYALVVRVLPGIAAYDFGSAWDEGYYAIAARGAAAHLQNWVYPFVFEKTLDRVLLNKPPAFFWLGAAALHLRLAPELALRLVSVLAGVASVVVFEALCRMYCRRRDALLFALVFATNPLHVAFSRVYQMDVLVLFYALSITYLLLSGIRRKSSRRILAAGPVLGLCLLTKLWAGALPVIALLPFFLCEARRRRAQRLGIAIALALISGLLVFSVWPVALSLFHSPYTGFLWMRPGSTVWDLLFSRYGTRLYGGGAVSVAEQFGAPYLSLGHFHVARPAVAVGVGLALAGAICFLLTLASRSSMRRRSLYRAAPVILWVIGYLPVAFGRDHYLQYLLVLLPAWSIVVGKGLGVPLRFGRVGVAACAALAVALLVEPAYLILHGDEILYRTQYREMGAYIAARSTGAAGSTECRYPPGLSYYTGRMERPYDSRRPIEKSVRRGVVRFVDVKWSRRDNTLGREDRRWVRTHCANVSAEARLSKGGPHALYDCLQAQSP